MSEFRRNINELQQSLRNSLVEYRERRPHLSLRAIAKHSGVNRYFLNKILDEKDDFETPLDLNQVMLLAKFVSKQDKLNKLKDVSSALHKTIGAALGTS